MASAQGNDGVHSGEGGVSLSAGRGREVRRKGTGKLGRGHHVVRAWTFQGFFLLLKIIYLLAVLGLHCSLAFSWLHRVGAPLQLRRAGSLLWWLLWLLTTGSGPLGFSHSGSWAPEHRLSTWGTRV